MVEPWPELALGLAGSPPFSSLPWPLSTRPRAWPPLPLPWSSSDLPLSAPFALPLPWSSPDLPLSCWTWTLLPSSPPSPCGFPAKATPAGATRKATTASVAIRCQDLIKASLPSLCAGPRVVGPLLPLSVQGARALQVGGGRPCLPGRAVRPLRRLRPRTQSLIAEAPLFAATGTDSKAIEAPAQAAEPGARRALLTCAMAAPALYVGLDALAARLYHDYSYRDQTISELSAVGAPTRPLWVAVGSVDSLLALAGAVGTWLSAGRRPVVRAVAAMAGAVGALGLLAWPFAPMHRREVLAAGGSTGADTAHIVLAGVDSALFLAMMAIGSRALGRRF